MSMGVGLINTLYAFKKTNIIVNINTAQKYVDWKSKL